MKTKLGEIVFHKTQFGFNTNHIIKKGELHTQNHFYENPEYNEGFIHFNHNYENNPSIKTTFNSLYQCKKINRKSFCQNVYSKEVQVRPKNNINITYDFSESSNSLQPVNSTNSNYKSNQLKKSLVEFQNNSYLNEIEQIEKQNNILCDNIKKYRMKNKLENFCEKPKQDQMPSLESIKNNNSDQKNTVEYPHLSENLRENKNFRPMTSIINYSEEGEANNSKAVNRISEVEKLRPKTHHSENIEKILLKERPNSRYNKKTICCPIPKIKENVDFDVKISKMDINTFSSNSEVWPSFWKRPIK